MDDLERRFNGAMVSIYETVKRELGYDATRFVQMISEQGGLTTARLWWQVTTARSGGRRPAGVVDLCARLSVPPPRLLTTASGMSIRFTCGSRRGHQCCAGPRRITSRWCRCA